MEAEGLREVAERFAESLFFTDDVDIAEGDRARVRLLQRCEDAHERRLAGAVASEETEHARRNVERDAFQCLSPVGVGLGEISNREEGGHGGSFTDEAR